MIRRSRSLVPLCLALLLAGAGPSGAAPQGASLAAPVTRIVLVAGDSSLPVFDNAVRALAARLARPDGPTIERFSASLPATAQPGVRPATLRAVLVAVAAMHPLAGQGCLVFATSHGGHHRGLYLSLRDEFLTPEALDHALAAGCGTAPTAVVISGCFSGAFARPPMARANRVVLTAASADRTSFGCGAGRSYTVYDRCLLDSLPGGSTPWRQVYAAVRRCVSAEEKREDATPSLPQAWFGAEGPVATPNVE